MFHKVDGIGSVTPAFGFAAQRRDTLYPAHFSRGRRLCGRVNKLAHGADGTDRGEAVAPYPHFTQLAAAHDAHQRDIDYGVPVRGGRPWAVPPMPHPSCFQPAFDTLAERFRNANQVVNLAHLLEEVCKWCGTELYAYTAGDAEMAMQRQAGCKNAQYLPRKNTAHQLFCKLPALQDAAATAAAAQSTTKAKVLKEWFNEAAAGRGPHIAQLRAAQAQAESMRNDFYRLRDSTACELVDSEADTESD